MIKSYNTLCLSREASTTLAQLRYALMVFTFRVSELHDAFPLILKENNAHLFSTTDERV